MLAKLLIGNSSSFWKLRAKYKGKSNIKEKIAKVLTSWYLYENNSSIDWDSEIIGEPCFPHGIKGVFISGAAKIGINCTIFQQVTIGSITFPDSQKAGAPVLGNNVYIGAGAKIIGNVIVGDNVRVGANAVVYQNIPNNSIVVAGGQMIKTKKTILTNKYYSFNEKNRSWVYFDNGKWKQESDAKIITTLSLSQYKDSKCDYTVI
ncbi:serine acetyltransferase [Psychromonas antarctica]|uniref:serine acetyltransferase n=1 Tax=Psychromonas antarctica TaxID=67573 RepID=UPI001EE97AD0|nr:serine acetyltransferase [Psychromonas antarctica]MCG6201302.1 serine acetyltransferase [Psychromonas antarctica]